MTDDTAQSHEPAGEIPSGEARALFWRWRAEIAALSPADLSSVDLMEFAAWCRHSGDETATAAIDAALTRDAELIETLLALRAGVTPESPSAAFLARVQALVPVPAAPSAVAIPFLRVAPSSRAGRPRAPIHVWLGLSALAASLVLVSIGGFNAGVSLGNNVAPALQGRPAPAAVSESDAASSVIDDVVG